jgi:Flp pilus assembly protein TadG
MTLLGVVFESNARDLDARSESVQASWRKQSVMKALSRFKRGQAVVILTLVIPALIGAVALGTDVALFYYNWIKLQKATDAAVLGGASYLPSNPNLAVATARKLATLNGIKPTEIVFTLVASNNMSMTMGVTRTLPHLFGRVLGPASGNVTAAATAAVAAAHSVRGLVPIGIQYGTSLASYRPLTLKLASQDGSTGPGSWQPLAMVQPASSAATNSNYRENIEFGYPSTIRVGDSMTIERGDVAGVTWQGINYRLGVAAQVDVAGTPTDYTLNDPRIIEVPIIDSRGVQHDSKVPVLGFAELWVQNIDHNGDISCEFIDKVSADNEPGYGAPRYGALSVVLMQ